MRRVLATIVAVQNQLVLHTPEVFLCSLSYYRDMRVRHIVIFGLSGSTVFFHIIS